MKFPHPISLVKLATAGLELFALGALLPGQLWFGFHFSDPASWLTVSLCVALIAWLLSRNERLPLIGLAAGIAVMASAASAFRFFSAEHDAAVSVVNVLAASAVTVHFAITKFAPEK